MKKIKFFSSYCSQEQIYKNVISSWARGSETYKDLLITLGDDYEYAVIFNRALPDKDLPKSRVVGFSHEPRSTLRLDSLIESEIQERASSYFLSNSEGLSDSFKSGYSFVLPAEFGKSELEQYSHEKRMSMILSQSNFMPGHRMRHEILKRVLKTDLDIHFYAEGLNKIYHDPRVKEFNWGIFNVPYEQYQTQIVIENIIDGMWSTEKLSNCIAKETFPVYYGSKKVAEDFYGEGSIPMLGNDLDQNIEIINDIYRNFSVDNETVKKAKEKLYSEKNLMEFLYQYFK